MSLYWPFLTVPLFVVGIALNVWVYALLWREIRRLHLGEGLLRRIAPRRKPAPPPRSDPARIAALEWEIFGIEPPPGTTAAALVGIQQLVRALAPDR